jgi:glycopeptide antibiotics resistance protein
VAIQNASIKALSIALFGAYLFVLLWVVLFKFSYDPLNVLREAQIRSLNLTPFAWANTSEMIANFVAFVPFGVMLGVNFKNVALKTKGLAVLAFSIGVEIIQFTMAIGVTDITDVIMNTLGGWFGLVVYRFLNKHVNVESLDRGVFALGTMTLVAILYLRIFVFIVNYG